MRKNVKRETAWRLSRFTFHAPRTDLSVSSSAHTVARLCISLQAVGPGEAAGRQAVRLALLLIAVLVGLLLTKAAAAGEGAMHFEGKGEILEVSHCAALDLQEAVSLEAWIRPEQLDQMGGRILDKSQAGTSSGYMLDTFPGNSLRMIVAEDQLGFDAKLPAGQWSHVSGVFSAKEGVLKLYLNGKEVASKTKTPMKKLIRNTVPLRIGADSQGGSRFKGDMARVTVYSRALTADEVASLAGDASRRSRDLPGRVGDWDFASGGEKAFISSAPGALRIRRPVAITGQAAPPTGQLTLWYRQPAREWVEALPIGNGRLGGMVFGRVDEERIQLNEGTIWAGGPYDPSHPEALEALPKARKLIFDGKFREAHNLIGKKMMARPLGQMPYQPLGDLLLKFPDVTEAADYCRDLDLDTAIARVTYTVGGVKFAREVLASAPDQAIVVSLAADKPGQVSFVATMASPQKVTVKAAEPDLLIMDGVSGDCQSIQGAVKFQSRARVRADGGKVTIADSSITVSGANAAVLVLVAATSYVNYKDVTADPEARAKEYLARIADKPYERIRAGHVAEHQRLFRRVTLDVGVTDAANRSTDERIRTFSSSNDPAMAALYFQFGRYLLMSCSRPGGQPATLQGLWNESMSPPWDSKYTININTEMNYWPVEITNLSECHEPLLRMVSELVEPGSRTAKVNWGAGGWVCHHNTDLWRATAPIDGPTWGFWPTGGAWLCRHLWEHYLFSGDRDFLQQAYPVMAGAAQFFLDSLVEHPTKKFLVTCPSLSPENTHPGGASVCAGPTMDMQIIRDLFDSCIQAGRILEVDPAFGEQVKQARERLAPNQSGANGQLKEWLDDWDMKAPEIRHRHVSHLYGVFPSSQITLRGTPDLAAAARKSLEIRGDAGTGWSLAWKVNLWARFADGDHAYKILSMLLTAPHTFPNMFDSCPPFQIDGNFGGCAGIAELLLQSHAGEIHFLPALPKEWPTGAVKGLRARGGFEVDIRWQDGRLSEATVRSKLGWPCKVRYGGKVVELKTEAGKGYTLDGALERK